MLSYQNCLNIVKNNENFYEKVEMVDGYKVSIFNYILSIHQFFLMPYENAEHSAVELRGLTFVHQPDGSVVRFLMLNKFFNLNEVPENQFELLKDKKIISIQDKADGSMIRFIQLPNKIIAVKTKNGFTNDQCVEATALYKKNANQQEFVRETLEQDIAAMFELTSPNNKIVLNYNEAELVLTQMRDEKTGKYLDIYNHPLVKKYNIKCVKKYDPMTLEEMMNLQLTLEGVEGFIVIFEDGHMIKIKTKWYMDRHRVLDNSTHENEVVKMILEEKLDDAIAILDADNERRKYAESMQLFMAEHIKDLLRETMDLLKTFNGDRKEFALKNIKHPRFAIAAKFLDNPNDVEGLNKKLKERIYKDCFRLKAAKEYLSENGFKVLNFDSIDEG